MNLIELSELLLDEKKAEQFLLDVGILKSFTACEKCASSKLGRIRRGRYKCYGCKAEWSVRKNSMLFSHQISYSNFIGLLKCFEIDLAANQTAKELGIEKTGVQRIYNLIRESIIGDYVIPNGDLILKQESPTFSVEIVNGIAEIKLDTDSTNKNLFRLKRSRVPNKETTFQFHYSRINSKDIRNRIDQFPIEHKYFWRYANIKMQSFRGTKLKYLYLYLKEIEFRYNNQINLFDRIVEKTAKFEGWS